MGPPAHFGLDQTMPAAVAAAAAAAGGGGGAVASGAFTAASAASAASAGVHVPAITLPLVPPSFGVNDMTTTALQTPSSFIVVDNVNIPVPIPRASPML